MSRCLITGEVWEGTGPYSPAGLRMLDRRLTTLDPIGFTKEQLLEEAQLRSDKMSIQGLQPKLSAVLRGAAGRMDIVDAKGRYILKPPHVTYRDLPENEALTMSLAATVGIEVPLHGLLLGIDGARTYFVRRFDRLGWGKVPVEDFAQLTGGSRDTKYDSSTERIIAVIDQFCSFPAIERIQMFRRLLFAFLTGNEDLHLKNWSVITRSGRVELSPGYDFLNSTIVLRQQAEELALPLNGKKSKLRQSDFWRYLALERLGLQPRTIEEVKAHFQDESGRWPLRIENSFLSQEMKEKYTAMLAERRQRLGFVA